MASMALRHSTDAVARSTVRTLLVDVCRFRVGVAGQLANHRVGSASLEQTLKAVHSPVPSFVSAAR